MADIKDWKNNQKDLVDFIKRLSIDDITNLLTDNEFKEYVCENITNVNVYMIFEVLTYDETMLFVDKKFVSLISGKPAKAFECVFSRIKSDALADILMQDYANELFYIDVLRNFINPSWPIELKTKIFNMAIEIDVNNVVLGSLTKSLYYERYVVDEDKDYSVNQREIAMIAEFLKDDAIKQRYFESVGLLMSLDPVNRSMLYKDIKSYSALSKKDKQNLIELLSMGYETNLPNTILDDYDFICDVSKIEDSNKYRMAKLCVKEQSESSYELIEQEKVKIVNRSVPIILNNDFKDLKEFDISKRELVNSIFYKYFQLSPRDVFIKACMIKDAMNSIDGYKDKFSEDGIYLIDKLVQLILTQPDLKNNNKLMYSSEFFKLSEDNYEIFQEVVYGLTKRDNWKMLFDKAINTAKNNFVEELNGCLYSPDSKNLVENEDGLKVYDITKNKRFHLLVHKTSVYLPSDFKFPELEEGQYLNTSMSVLNNNHLTTFGKDVDDCDIIFGYSHANADEVVHALPSDSFSKLKGNPKVKINKKFKEVETGYAATYLSVFDFMANMNRNEKVINEIKQHITSTYVDEKGRGYVVPDYILCKNEIREIDKIIAKKYNLPIVFVNENEVTKFSEENFTRTILYQSNASLGGAYEFENQFVEP